MLDLQEHNPDMPDKVDQCIGTCEASKIEVEFDVMSTQYQNVCQSGLSGRHEDCICKAAGMMANLVNDVVEVPCSVEGFSIEKHATFIKKIATTKSLMVVVIDSFHI